MGKPDSSLSSLPHATPRPDAGRWEKLAYGRTARLGKHGYFDAAAAERVVKFVGALCHSRGPAAGRRFLLPPWQDYLVRMLFGWKRSDGTRLFRRGFIGLPRKNGKSTLAAALALYFLFADGEPGPEVVCVAAAKEQARIILNQAMDFFRGNAVLRARAECYRNAIVLPEGRGHLLVVGKDPDVFWGKHTSAVLFDEVHAHANRDLWDAVNTSTVGRAQPLVLCLSTAGQRFGGIYDELRDYSEQVLEGKIDDPHWFAWISAADDDKSWDSEEAWRQANPGLGHSVQLEEIATVAQAAVSSAAQVAFRRYHLNQRVSSAEGFVPQDVWLEGQRERPEQLPSTCVVGLDLASRTDLSAAVAAYDLGGHWWIEPVAWTTRRALGGNRGRLYREWHEAGFLKIAGVDSILYEAIRQWFLELRENGVTVERMFCDPHLAHHLLQELRDDGFRDDQIVEIHQSRRHLDPLIRATERLIYERRLWHPRHPVLDWCVANVRVDIEDKAQKRQLDRQRSTGPIDLAAAMIFAVGGAETIIEQAAEEDVDIEDICVQVL
jgi:phage terminase large subunit-like protein